MNGLFRMMTIFNLIWITTVNFFIRIHNFCFMESVGLYCQTEQRKWNNSFELKLWKCNNSSELIWLFNFWWLEEYCGKLEFLKMKYTFNKLSCPSRPGALTVNCVGTQEVCIIAGNRNSHSDEVCTNTDYINRFHFLFFRIITIFL